MFKYMLEDEQEYLALLQATRLFRIRAAILAPANIFLKGRAVSWWRHVVGTDEFLRAFFYYAKRARSCETVVEKTPNHWQHLGELVGAFPQGRFLYVARHPIDQFTSYRRRANADAGAEWARRSARDFCEEYRRSTMASLNARTSVPHFLLLRYEDLTHDPEGTLDHIWRFLDVDPFPDAIHGLSSPATAWDADPYLFDDVTPITKDWRDFISNAEARAVESELRDLMKVLDYEPYALIDHADPRISGSHD